MEDHQRFKIVYQWLRFVGFLLGQDVVSDGFKINLYTVVVLLIGLSPLICIICTYIFYDVVDEALDSGSYFFIVVKVCYDNTNSHSDE